MVPPLEPYINSVYRKHGEFTESEFRNKNSDLTWREPGKIDCFSVNSFSGFFAS